MTFLETMLAWVLILSCAITVPVAIIVVHHWIQLRKIKAIIRRAEEETGE